MAQCLLETEAVQMVALFAIGCRGLIIKKIKVSSLCADNHLGMILKTMKLGIN